MNNNLLNPDRYKVFFTTWYVLSLGFTLILLWMLQPVFLSPFKEKGEASLEILSPGWWLVVILNGVMLTWFILKRNEKASPEKHSK